MDHLTLQEEQRREDKERSRLLAFSNDLATVRDSRGIQYILKQHLKTLLGVTEYLITVKNTGSNSYTDFLRDPESSGGVPRPLLSCPLQVGREDIGMLLIPRTDINQRLFNGVGAQIAIAISNVLGYEEIQRQAQEIRRYQKQLAKGDAELPVGNTRQEHSNELIGTSQEMQKIQIAIKQVAFTDTTVMILGETGTGKELIARAIHACSARKKNRMIKVNCAALPANLVESELFGHERGSFTGAIERKLGKFEQANNSTLFLDELGELPSQLQAKLLRVIQEREIERVGGKKTINVNVRIIAATNRDLSKEVEAGRFRNDLYHRLNVFPIFVPALRNRPEDIPLLADHFIQKLAGKSERKVSGMSTLALRQLIDHNWPGNIRELENCIERSLLMSPDEYIEQIDLPRTPGLLSQLIGQETICKTLRENERDHILAVLKKCNGRIGGNGGAAKLLNVNKSTLNSRMRKLGIKGDRSISDINHE